MIAFASSGSSKATTPQTLALGVVAHPIPEMAMPNWIRSLLRRIFPPLRHQDERIRASQRLIESARLTRHQSSRVNRLVRSYLRMDGQLRRAGR